MKTLQIDEKNARRLYNSAPVEFKTALEDTFGKEYFSQKITDRIKSYEAACYELGIDTLNEDEMKNCGFRQDEIDRRKIETITFALNKKEMLDWNNPEQRKYYPWFDASSGFVFDGTHCCYSAAGIASRLCFKSEELARYAGKQFLELYKSFMTN